MKHAYRYRYQRVLLRPLEEGDLEALRKLRNENRRFFNTTQSIAPQQQRVWFANYLERQNDLMFAVELNARPGEFAGAIALYDIDESARMAEFGRTLMDKEKATEAGIGTDAVLAVCRFAFEELGLAKITAEVLKTNLRAGKAYAKAGCVTVGETERSWRLEITPETIRSGP